MFLVKINESNTCFIANTLDEAKEAARLIYKDLVDNYFAEPVYVLQQVDNPDIDYYFKFDNQEQIVSHLSGAFMAIWMISQSKEQDLVI